MNSILKNWETTKRFITILGVAFIMIILLIRLIMNSFIENEFDVKYTTDKTLITIKDGHHVIATSVLSASECWTNTGIEIRPGETCRIKISGRIHTSADKMIDAAKSDSLPMYPWCDASGVEFKIRNDYHHYSDSIRKNLLVAPSRKIGAALLYVQKGNSKIPNCKLEQNHHLPEENLILNYEIDSGCSIVNDSNEIWYLWGSINDIIIKDFNKKSDKEAYFGGIKKESKRYSLKDTNWKLLVAANYNTFWFDDNIGNFIISAKIDRPHNFFSLW